MHERCEECGLDFQREQGFYLGSIYFNYGVTALAVAVAYPALAFSGTMTPNQALTTCMVIVVVLPLLLFRFARSLWLGFDEFIDPQQKARGN